MHPRDNRLAACFPSYHWAILLLILALSPFPLTAQETPPKPTLKEISPGIFQYQGIRLNKNANEISFPAVVNLTHGFLEYALVGDQGKVHESLLSTHIIPHDLHIAMLLIGLKLDEKANAAESIPPAALDSSYLHNAPPLKGSPVKIVVAWTERGTHHEIDLDKWILNLKTNQSMTPGSWTYNGSLIHEGAFLADRDLSLIAVVTDPTALVNNPRDGYNDDEIWQVNEKSVPPKDTPVQVTFHLSNPTN